MPESGLTQQQAIDARRKFVEGWNDLMVTIWHERLTLLDVIDTGALLDSVVSLQLTADDRIFDVSISHGFLEYGLWQNYGTGKETPRKGRPDEAMYRNPDGSLIRDKVREKKPWFSKKYFASVMTIKDFMADSIGQEFLGVMSDIFNDRALRQRYGKTYI